MKNPKPIFIVRLPDGVELKEGALSDLANDVSNLLDNEYHVLVTVSEYNGSDEIRFECFNSSEVKEIDIKTLQERIIALLPKQKNKNKLPDFEFTPPPPPPPERRIREGEQPPKLIKYQ